MRLSIIIPTHKRPEGLHRALASLTQLSDDSLSKVEVIVIEDAPLEQTLRVIDIFQGRIANLMLVSRYFDGGVAASRNLGMAACSGQLVTFLDDDMPNPRWIEAVMRTLGDSNVLLYGSWVRAIEDRTSQPWVTLARQKIDPPAEGNILERLQVRNQLAIGTFVLPRNVAKNIPFDNGLESHEDWDWLLSASKLISFRKLSEVAVHVSVSKNQNESRSESTRALWLESFRRIYSKHPTSSTELLGLRAQTISWLERSARMAPP